MIDLKLSYELDKLKDLVEERRRLVDVLMLTPSNGDTVQLKKQINRILAIFHDSDLNRGLITEYNLIIDDIPDSNNFDTSIYYFKIPSRNVFTSVNIVPTQDEIGVLPKKVRFNDNDLVSYNTPQDAIGIVEQEFKPYQDELTKDQNNTSASLISNKELFIQQQQELLNQDSHLDILSSSIKNTHYMSLDINREIEDQNDHVLQDLENLVDNNGRSLRRAQRRLEIFEKTAKENGPCFTIVILIIILLFLLVVL